MGTVDRLTDGLVVANCSYVFMVVIPDKIADKKYVDILKAGNPRVLPAWDVLGYVVALSSYDVMNADCSP